VSVLELHYALPEHLLNKLEYRSVGNLRFDDFRVVS